MTCRRTRHGVLARVCPKLQSIDLARLTMDLDFYVIAITRLVETISCQTAVGPQRKCQRRMTAR